jgi:hypothetical protein
MKQQGQTWQEWWAQWEEDKASQGPKDVENHNDEGQYLSCDSFDDSEYSKNQDQEWHNSHGK